MLHNLQPAVPRLALGPFHTGGEVLHGVLSETPCTVFPQAIGLGATWNPGLLRRIGDVIATEVESLLARDRHNPLLGPNPWSPVTNLLRDPRWGRNEEGYSEDPHLTAALAIGFCSGLRGFGPGEQAGRWRLAPTVKHFLAYNHENDRGNASVSLRPRVLREYELPSFLDPVRAGVVAAVMPSYGIVNGRPSHLSEHLAQLRAADPDLVVVSDGTAPSMIIELQHYYDSRESACAALIAAGLDSFTDHGDDPAITIAGIRRALETGLLSPEAVDAAATRLLLMRVRVGDLDPAAGPVPDLIDAPAHRELARSAVQQSLVLLENDATLPFSGEEGKTVAVIGPMADRICRDWYGGPMPYRVTPLDGITERARGEVVFASGLDRIRLRVAVDGRYLAVAGTQVVTNAAPELESSDFEVFDWGEAGWSFRSVDTGLFLFANRDRVLECNKEDLRAWNIRHTFTLDQDGASYVVRNVFSGNYLTVNGSAVTCEAEEPGAATHFQIEYVARGLETAAEAARQADEVIVCVGTHPQVNGAECYDRTSLDLPRTQERLVGAVVETNPNTAVVLISGYPLSVRNLKGRVPAMLWSSHGGQESGRGLADVIFGAYNPAGRLPQAWPVSAEELGDILDYDIIKSKKTYLFSDRRPLYPFGHGLSYSSFRYGGLVLDADTAGPQETVTATLEVSNIGPVDGDEVVQLYVRALEEHGFPLPGRQLRAFQRIHIPAGETRRVCLALNIAELAFWDVSRQTFSVAPGIYEVMVGSSSTSINATATITVTAPELQPRDLSARLTRAVDFDDYHKARIIDESPRKGEAVAIERAGGWLLFRNVLIPDGSTVATLRLGALEPSLIRAEVRIGDPESGRLLGSVAVPPDSTGRYAWQTVTARLASHPGIHDVYVVFTGPARVSALALTRSEDEEPT